MNILVLNGSPKGDYSITLQTAEYLEKLYENHAFSYINVGQRIKALEKDFSEVIDAVNNADLLLFCYPVYTFIAPYQLHRFIELLKESGISLEGKLATQITTSKHFYDVTAHKYIQDNCQDMGIKFIRGLSADMEDLLSSKGQHEADKFFKYILYCAENDIYELVRIINNLPVGNKATPVTSDNDKNGDIVIVTDCTTDNTQLSSMIERFRAVSLYNSRIVNLNDFPFKGGCLGCMNCAVDGKCVYKDGFDEYLRTEIQSGQAIIYAFTIKDHSMGSLFKLYDDRQFCNGHRSVTMGMPVGYIISGNLKDEPNLNTIIEGRANVGGNFLVGTATDESDTDKQIDSLAKSLQFALENNYNPPANFYGVGGMKIFRDLIYKMKGMMKADHKFYKAHGQYDFPQKHKGTMLLMYLVGAMMSNPKIKAKMGNKMNEGMLMPYKKVLDALDKDKE